MPAKPDNDSKSGKDKRQKTREDIHIDLTVRVHFGEQYEPVTLLNDRRIPFVQAMLMLRKNAGSLIYTAILKAAVMQPKVMRTILPVATSVPSKAVSLINKFTRRKKKN